MTASGDEEGATVRLLVDRDRHGRRLDSWLRSRSAFRISERPDEPADLCIADPGGLRRSAAEIAARQDQTEGWLPVLLVVPAAREASPDDLAAFEAEFDLHIDATVEAPLRDATLSRQVETLLRGSRLARALSEAEERYRSLVELSPEAILVLSEECIDYANNAARRLLDAEELTGRSLAEFVADEERDRLAETLADADGRFDPMEFHTDDGRRVACEVAATAVEQGEESVLQVVVRDVSERVQNEERLRLYRRAMDDTQQGITIADAQAEDLPLIYANEAFERITGYPVEEVIGRNCRFLQGPGTDSETVDEIREALEAGEPVAVEILNYRRDSTPFWNELTIAPMRNAEGELTHFIGHQQDVTERKQRFQRLTVLDRVLRHNIRNKTNVIAGYAADIESGASDDPTAAARRAREAAMDLLSISEAARDFHTAMDEEGQTVRDLDALVRNAVATAREEYGERADISVDAGSVAAMVTPAVQLAVEELIGNAVEHSDREPASVSVSVGTDGPWAEIAVADQGPGIPESVLRVIGSRGETPTEHLGRLGLWLVSWAVRGAGGELAFEENEPRGTVIRMRLPRAASGGTEGSGTDTD